MSRLSSTICGLAVAAVMTAVPGGDAQRLADVQALPGEQIAGRQVTIRGGVVTWIKMPERSRFTIQDDDRGMWITTKDPLPKAPDYWRGGDDVLASLAVGDEVEIDGTLDPGGFAPKLLASDLRIVGRRQVPEPAEIDDERFFTGADECCRVAITGVVQGFREMEGQWALLLERNTRRFEARVPKEAFPDPSTELVDAKVRLIGSTIAAFNARGELLYPRVLVMDAADIAVLVPPPCQPFEAPFLPVARIATFRSDPAAGHRLRTQGTVNYVFPGGFSLQDGPAGIRVETAGAVDVAVNDRVAVAGFLDRRRHAAGLHQAVVQVLGRGVEHSPIEVMPADIVQRFKDARLGGTIATPGDYDGCLLTFEARLAAVDRDPVGGRLLLNAGGLEANVVARMDEATFSRVGLIRPGSRLRMTGVLQIQAMTPALVWSELEIDHLALGLRSADDVIVLEAPSWWTARRLGLLAAALAAIIATGLGWVGLLRRQVRSQAARITHELENRRNAAVEFQATLRERNRLAANLHDTILQTLAGVILQLDVCRRRLPTATPDDSTDQLDMAKRMVRHAAEDLRGSVWALRTQPMAGRSFPESLHAIVHHFADTHRGNVALEMTGTAFPLPRFVAGNLLLVVQEAIRNACNHAHAGRVAVTVHRDPATRTVHATIHDDGTGFDLETAAGPEQGHFGLQGMRERIESLGGDLTIRSTPGRGTTVETRVVVNDQDAALDREDAVPAA